MRRMNEYDLRRFLIGKTLYAFEPETRENIAKVTYRQDGCSTATFADGTEDKGQFGFSGDTYWTRYARFRSGQTNYFYLILVEPEIAQAFHTDGRRAFLQSTLVCLGNNKLDSH